MIPNSPTIAVSESAVHVFKVYLKDQYMKQLLFGDSSLLAKPLAKYFRPADAPKVLVLRGNYPVS